MSLPGKVKTMSSKFPAIVFLLGIPLFAFAADFSRYKQLATDTIEQAKKARENNSKIDDIDGLIKMQEQLIEIGVEACNEFAAANPDSSKVLNLVTTNANQMKLTSLEEIETKWHGGTELEKHGYTLKDDDHFGPVGNLIDMVIHPATTYIALNEYKKTGNKSHLDRVVAELSEVLAHISQLQ